jgi:hypothetical protein
MHLQYGVVSLRGRPWTQTSETLRDFVLEAEDEATRLEQRLREAYGPESGPRQTRATSAAPRKKRKAADRIRKG